MAMLRIFVSSTYYDLKYIRDRLESFIHSMGYDPVLFETGSIPFMHDRPFDKSCYAEIESCQMLVLIIGSRYGSPASGELKVDDDVDGKYSHYNSITMMEYKRARENDIPIYIFVEKNVLAEFETFKRNKGQAVSYAHVDSENIFLLIEDIYAQSLNNLVRGFETFDDIADWLRNQWSGLFADLLTRRSDQTSLSDMASRINELGQITKTLQDYTEKLLRSTNVPNADEVINQQRDKQEQHKLNEFRHQGLTDYLLGLTKGVIGTEQLFDIFKIATTIEDLFKRCNLVYESHQPEFKEIMSRDFSIIKSRFFEQSAQSSRQGRRFPKMSVEETPLKK